jgi:hypothetical protein
MWFWKQDTPEGRAWNKKWSVCSALSVMLDSDNYLPLLVLARWKENIRSSGYPWYRGYRPAVLVGLVWPLGPRSVGLVSRPTPELLFRSPIDFVSTKQVSDDAHQGHAGMTKEDNLWTSAL